MKREHKPVLNSAVLMKFSESFQVRCECTCGDANCVHVHDVYVSDLMLVRPILSPGEH